MRKPTSVILAALAAIVLSGCTLGQQLRWVQAHLDGHGAEADAAAQVYLDRKATATAGRPCAELYDYAIEAGFTPQQWEWPLSQTLWGESHCNPLADNPTSSARGVAQILDDWIGPCGVTYTDLYDPGFNLRCAYLIWTVQGWGAWQAAPAGAR